MATYNKFLDASEQIVRGTHDFDANTFKIALSNTLPLNTNTIFSDIIEIAPGNGYAAGGTATTVSIAEVAGTTTVSGTSVVFTATGGPLPTSRYFVLYNDSAAAKNLIAWWDYGAPFTLADGESVTWKPSNASPGAIFTLV